VRSKDQGEWRVTGYQVEVVPSRAQMGLFYDEGGRGFLARPGERVAINEKGEIKVVGLVGDLEKIQSLYREKDWNELLVVARGSQMVQKINGVVFSELTDEDEKGRALSGVLALQIHTGPPMLVEFKDIRIKAPDEKVVSLFNGKDLTGWKIAETWDSQDTGRCTSKTGRLCCKRDSR
jgi:hypothetical protein